MNPEQTARVAAAMQGDPSKTFGTFPEFYGVVEFTGNKFKAQCLAACAKAANVESCRYLLQQQCANPYFYLNERHDPIVCVIDVALETYTNACRQQLDERHRLREIILLMFDYRYDIPRETTIAMVAYIMNAAEPTLIKTENE